VDLTVRAITRTRGRPVRVGDHAEDAMGRDLRRGRISVKRIRRYNRPVVVVDGKGIDRNDAVTTSASIAVARPKRSRGLFPRTQT
jgi:hypothetical protein